MGIGRAATHAIPLYARCRLVYSYRDETTRHCVCHRAHASLTQCTETGPCCQLDCVCPCAGEEAVNKTNCDDGEARADRESLVTRLVASV